ncbi:MAG: potassium channel family protein [Syntrophobacteraceae bacterium]
MSVTGKIIVAVDILVSVGVLSCLALLMARQFLASVRASAHRIAGAVAIYLLLGLIWTRMYQLVELVSPGSFRIHEGETLNAGSLAYFSFVTLATLGYGDIVPTHIVARDLAVLEAIMGQLYMVILISRLVSEGSAKHPRLKD